MIINSIELYRISVPYDSWRRKPLQAHDPYNMALSPEQDMECLMVALRTTDGYVGWGEAFGHKCNPATWAAITETLAPYLLGREVTDVQMFQEDLRRTFHGFGQSGPVMYGISAIDIALWDIAAQRADMPLYLFLGGESDHVSVYPSLPAYDDEAEIVWQIERVLSLGYTRIKLHETSLTVMQAALNAMKSGSELMVDVNCAWDVETALVKAAALHAQGMAWLEEPVWPPDDLNALSTLRETGILIAAGENASGIGGLLQHFERGAIDVAQPSVAKIGGLTGMLSVVAAASRYGVQVVPHCFYYGPGMLATAHLVSCLGGNVALEVPFLRFHEHPHAWMNFKPKMALPKQPGLGFVPDHDVIRRCTIQRTTLR